MLEWSRKTKDHTDHRLVPRRAHVNVRWPTRWASGHRAHLLKQTELGDCWWVDPGESLLPQWLTVSWKQTKGPCLETLREKHGSVHAADLSRDLLTVSQTIPVICFCNCIWVVMGDGVDIQLAWIHFRCKLIHHLLDRMGLSAHTLWAYMYFTPITGVSIYSLFFLSWWRRALYCVLSDRGVGVRFQNGRPTESVWSLTRRRKVRKIKRPEQGHGWQGGKGRRRARIGITGQWDFTSHQTM